MLQALVDGAEVELSPLMVEHEAEHIQDDQARVLSQINVRMDDYLRSMGKTAEEMRTETQDEAIGRLKRTFLLTRVAEAEGIAAADEEVEEKVKEMLSESREGAPRVQDSDELRGSLRRSLLVEKTIDRLVAIAKGEAASENAQGQEPEPASADKPDEAPADATPEGGDAVDPQT